MPVKSWRVGVRKDKKGSLSKAFERCVMMSALYLALHKTGREAKRKALGEM